MSLDQAAKFLVYLDQAVLTVYFWAGGVLSFSKGAIAKPETLKKALVINFVNGEDGCDAGQE